MARNRGKTVASTHNHSPKKFHLVRPEQRNELIISLTIVVAAVLVPIVLGSVYWQQTAQLAAVYLIAASGLSVLKAQAEQISFGQGAIVGVAAYSMALSVTVWELPVMVGALVGLLSGMFTGFLLSLPSLRVQGYYLGFVTMAGALTLPELLFLFKDETRAMTGVNILPSEVNDIAFWRIDWLTLIILVAAVGSVILVGAVKASRFGRQLRMTGTSAEAASTMGLRPGRLRLLAFALSSATASVAGVLYVLLIQYVAPGSFTLALSILLYFVVVIGGAGAIAGAITGVVILYIVPDVALASLIDYRLMIYGVIAFAVMFWMPDGIAGGVRRISRRLSKHKDAEHRGIISLEPILRLAPPYDSADSAISAGQPAVLSVEGISRRFGAVQALGGISLQVGSGQIHAIVGPNGSGKTTLLNAISGLVAIDGGTIRFNGTDVTRAPASQRARLGLGRTFQTPRVLTDMSVWENIDCGPAFHASGEAWLNEAFESIREEWDKIPASTLPHGQRRFLEVIRALRLSPTLLALDEPAAGLSHAERAEFGQLLRTIVQATGASVLMVEHDLELVWGSADVITVVDGGKVVISGTPAELRHAPEISRLFTGVNHVEN